jgi:hypothetical protein
MILRFILVSALVLSSAMTVVTPRFLLVIHLSEVKVKSCNMAKKFQIESLIPLYFT